jgi:hypothetical protein
LIEKQGESERASQLNDKILQAKVDLYNRLLGQVKDVMLREEVSYADQVEIQIINQQLSYCASEEVLEAFNKFAGLFNAVASAARAWAAAREGLPRPSCRPGTRDGARDRRSGCYRPCDRPVRR